MPTISTNFGIPSIEANTEDSLQAVLTNLPDNTSELISPRDVRNAIFTLWDGNVFKVLEQGTDDFIGIDSSIRRKILFGKKDLQSNSVLDTTLLSSDSDFFFFNNKTDVDLSEQNTKITYLAGDDTTSFINAPYSLAYKVTDGTNNWIDLSFVNSATNGSIILNSNNILLGDNGWQIDNTTGELFPLGIFNIGKATALNRVSTIFMSSTIDYIGNLEFKHDTNSTARVNIDNTGILNVEELVISDAIKYTNTPSVGYVLTSDANGNMTLQPSGLSSLGIPEGWLPYSDGSGNINWTDAYLANGVPTGRVLVSNGSNFPSWQTVSSIIAPPIDNLTTQDANEYLSANQGYILHQLILSNDTDITNLQNQVNNLNTDNIGITDLTVTTDRTLDNNSLNFSHLNIKEYQIIANVDPGINPSFFKQGFNSTNGIIENINNGNGDIIYGLYADGKLELTDTTTNTITMQSFTSGGNNMLSLYSNTVSSIFIGNDSNISTKNLSNSVTIGHSNTTSTNSVVIGNNISNSGENILVGDNITTATTQGVAIGKVLDIGGSGSVAIGRNTQANSISTVAIGDSVVNNNSASTSIGSDITNSSLHGVTIGRNLDIGTGVYGIAIGRNLDIGSGYSNILIGGTSNINNGSENVIIGRDSSTDGNTNVAIGDGNLAGDGDRNVVIGNFSYTTATVTNLGITTAINGGGYFDSVVIGASAQTGGDGSIAVGHNAETTNNQAVAIGENAISGVGLALGYNTTNNGGIAIGYDAGNTGFRGLAIGTFANSSSSTGGIINLSDNIQTNSEDNSLKIYTGDHNINDVASDLKIKDGAVYLRAFNSVNDMPGGISSPDPAPNSNSGTMGALCMLKSGASGYTLHIYSNGNWIAV